MDELSSVISVGKVGRLASRRVRITFVRVKQNDFIEQTADCDH